MTESSPFTQIQDLSTALASLVASTAPSVTAVQSHRSRSSGFVWRPGLIVTADEALSEDGEFAVTGGDTVPAQLVGRDPTTDVALLRVDRSDLRPVPLEAAPVSVGALAIAMGAEDDAPPRCEQRRRQGDAVPRRTLRIAADWFPPPGMKLTTR